MQYGLLVNYLLESIIKKENKGIGKSSIIGTKLKKRLKTNFKAASSPEKKNQNGEEIGEGSIEPIESSTPLKTEEIENIYNQEKEDFLKTKITINKTDLETAVEMAEDSNEAAIDEIVNPTPGLIVHDTVNVDSQVDFEKNDLDATFRLSNTLQERMDNILDQARKKVSSHRLPGEVIGEIPNHPLTTEKSIETEDIYLDNSLRQLFISEN